MILWLSGPTGSGKSSLARLFGSLGFEIIQEKLPSELFERFTENPPKYCASLQAEIMRSRYQQWIDCRHKMDVVFDRTLEEDLEVFCKMHHENGFLDLQSLEGLQTLARSMSADMTPPDLIIYMHNPLVVLRERITLSGHLEVIRRALPRQVELYDDWISRRPNNVLKLDNSACSFASIAQLLSGCNNA